jgi:microcystin-dependent protein
MGELRMMSFNFAPKGWAQCNGQLLPINQNQALGATPAGTAVVLNNTRGITLNRMRLHNNSNYGVRGTSVVGFTLAAGTAIPVPAGRADARSGGVRL